MVENTNVEAENPPASSGERQEESNAENNHSTHLNGFHLISVIVSLGLALFIGALDQSIVSTLIPSLTNTFHSIENVSWFGSVYLLMLGACQLPFGKLYSTYSSKLIFLLSVSWLSLGSLICALAQNAPTFIIGRAFAGVGAAGIVSGAMVIVSLVLPLHLRPLYGGILGSLEGLAVIVGPIMGGSIATTIGWRWCFWINLPAAAVLSVAIIFFFHPPQAKARQLSIKQQIGQLDLLGSGGVIVTFVCLLLALDWGGTKYNWTNARIIVLLAVFGVLLITIVLYESRRGEKALIPGRFFRNRSFLSCVWYGFCLTSAQMVLIYNLPIWFQVVKKADASASGRMLLPTVISIIVGGILAGGLATILGYLPPFMILGSILTTVGTALIYTFQPFTSPALWIGYQVIYGFGCGIGIQQPLVGVQVALAQNDIPVGTATVMLGNTLGGAVFISVAQNIFISRLKFLTDVLPGVDVEALLGSGLTSFRDTLSPEQLQTALAQYNAAIRQTFLLALVLGGLSIFGSLTMEWKKLKKPEPMQSAVEPEILEQNEAKSN